MFGGRTCLLACILLLAGCSRSGLIQHAEALLTRQSVGSFASLPAPSAVRKELEPRQSSYLPSDLIKYGSDYDLGLPHQRVVQSGNDCAFTPDWDSPTKVDFAGLSFATYNFVVKGYAGSPKLYHTWSMPSGKPGNVYFAVANWGQDRWDWYRGTAASNVSLPDTSRYIDFGGNMLVCVMRVGTDASDLSSLRLGSEPPTATLSLSAKFGLVPLNVTLDASASTDVDGSIVKYQWDPEGDGTFQVEGGTVPTLDWQYAAAGEYAAAVKVTDDTGTYSIAEAVVRVAPSTFFTYGDPNDANDVVNGTAVNSKGKVWLAGRAYPSGQDNGLLIGIDPVTGARSAQTWDSGAGDDSYFDLAMANGDTLYVCGDTDYGLNSAAGLVQSFAPDGTLLWSKVIETTQTALIYLEAVDVTPSGVYSCGVFRDDTGREFGLVIKLDLSGNLLWKHTVISDQDCLLYGLKAHVDQTTGAESIYMTGKFHRSSASYDLLFVHMTDQGDLVEALSWGQDPDYEEGREIMLLGSGDPSVYLVAYISAAYTKLALTQPHGGSWIVSAPTSSLYPQSLGTTAKSAVALYVDSTSGLNILNFDWFLTPVSQDLLSGSAGLNGMGLPYGADGLFIGGRYKSTDTPAFSGGGLSITDGGILWNVVSPPIGNPTGLTADDAPTSIADVSSDYGNQGDPNGDPFIFMDKYK